jgi:hypothetical protein
VRRSRLRRFNRDDEPPPTGNDGGAERAWRRRVAEAARRAADDLGGERSPQLSRLHADLIDLATRLTAADGAPLEADDPRGTSQ